MYPILLISLVVAALVAAALSAALIADSGKVREFSLPEKSDRDDIVNQAARLAVMPPAVYDVRGDIALARKYINNAFRVIARKSASSTECNGYEKRFADNYSLIRAACDKAAETAARLARIAASRKANIVDLAETIVRQNAGVTDKELVRRCVNVFTARTTIPYSELRALGDALNYALIKQFAVYASKIIYRYRAENKARADARAGRINEKYIKSLSYVKTLFEYSDTKGKHRLTEYCGRRGGNVHSAASDDARLLAEYSGGMDALTDSLRAESTDEEFITEISAAGKIYARNKTGWKDVTVKTRIDYLLLTEKAAKKNGESEAAFAARISRLSEKEGKDISEYLIPPPSDFLPIITSIVSALISFGASACVALYVFPTSAIGIIAAIALLPVFFKSAFIICDEIAMRLVRRRTVPETLNGTLPSSAIVICAAVSGEKALKTVYDDLLTIAAANRNAAFSYGLLVDCIGSYDIDSAAKNIYSLVHGTDGRVFVCLRKKAYERKRGALIDFNKLVLNGDRSPFAVVLGGIKPFRYAITLDSDSKITDAERLVRIMEHPYNKRYAIGSLSMRSSTAGLDTPFARLFGGEKGISSYSYSSGLYFNACGFASYTGKGIYRIKEMNDAVAEAFPDGKILSHDMIEGALAGCCDTGVSGTDDFPHTPSAYLSRAERWMRGDLQLLPFLRKNAPDKFGRPRGKKICAAAKLVAIRNAVDVLTPLAAFAVAVISVFINNPILLITAYLPQIIGALFAFTIIIGAPNAFFSCLLQNIFWAMCLPTLAYTSLKAVAYVTVCTIKGKGLLRWKTYSSTLKGAMFCSVNIAAAAFFAVVAPFTGVVAAICAVINISALGLGIVLSVEKKPAKIAEDERRFAIELAEKTWEFFRRSLRAFGRLLPSDNFSDEKRWADRTSPTNIGMALCAAVCACELKFVTESERDLIVGGILDEIEKLEKYKGCLYNWYSVSDGRALSPKYVSSVDSGNFLASLMVVRAFVGKCADRADLIIKNTDMSFLQDKNGQLRIGYNVETQRADCGHYDLLGSESALTYLTLTACGKSGKKGYMSLSRRSAKYAGKRMLVSWSGGAFEYLLPLLFFRSPEYSLVGRSAANTLYAQKKYAAKVGSELWGASESLYAERYENGDLKYRAFGVPEISLSSGRSGKVFAPYASVMYFGAVSQNKAPLRNMLEKYTCDYGLIDSVDCAVNKVQHSAMSHHQGMILLSLCAALCGDVVRNKLTENAGVRAASLLLDEDAVFASPEKRYVISDIGYTDAKGYHAGGRSRYPQLNFLTDGKYRVIIDEHGRNFSVFGNLPLSRFDRLEGLRIFVKENGSVRESAAYSECFHGVNYSEFISPAESGHLYIKCALLFGENAEIRHIIYENTTEKPIVMSVIAGVKPVLCPISVDLAHKAFSSMFVETFKSESGNFVCARRTDSESKNVLALFADKPSIYCGDERYARTHSGVRFGRTTEPWLGTESEFIVPPHGSAEINVVMAYGTEKEIASLVKKIFDVGFAEYSMRKSSAYDASYFSAQTRNIGALLLLGGRKNGVPREIVVRADDDNSKAATDLLRELETLSGFGARFSVLLTGNLPYSYSDCRRTALLEAAAKLGDKCRIANEFSEEEIPAYGDCIYAFECNNALLPPFAERTPRPMKETELRLPEIVYKLGIGGFTENGGYLIDEKTPVPWCNVISDGKIGCITSSEGGFTFARNSRQEKYTRHTNDELNDRAGDGAVLGEGGTLWSVTRSPIEKDCRYAALHESGYSVYYCGYNGLRAEQKVFVKDGVKYISVSLENPYARKRVIDIMYFTELVMGDFYQECAGGIKCGEYADGIYAVTDEMKLYLTCSEEARSTAYFVESYRDGVGKVRVCTDLHNDGMTPALAYSCRVTIGGKSRKNVTFAMSSEPISVTSEISESVFKEIENNYYPQADVQSDGKTGFYLKRLFYQTYTARFTARCGFQQVSGAIGFRDRLQDCMALTGAVPSEVRKCLTDCAAHQFKDGDVMHWWHEPRTGVRTRICDDKLFLPYAVAEYIERTGDESVLSEEIAYLADKRIPAGEHSVYACMEVGEESDCMREHIMRAFRSVKISSRGLVLMGTGDWNDGMDRLGEKGRGESVWCSMFAYYTAGRFLPYADEKDRAFLASMRKTLKSAIVKQKRGDRYVRAYDDNGNPIGVEENAECRIDLLVQSWAVLSGIETGESARKVLESAYRKLYDKKHKLIKLLDPSFTDKSIGYIAEYPRGVRENGGQYTHAAVWFIRALYEVGMTDKANELLFAILPDSHTADKESVKTYLKEPYVIAGDVYSGKLAGRGGWTWYTGSAGWLYRVIAENYCGVIVRREAVKFAPNIPVGEKAELTVKLNSGKFKLYIDGTEDGEWHLSVDGIEYGACRMPVTSLAGRTVKLKRCKSVD